MGGVSTHAETVVHMVNKNINNTKFEILINMIPYITKIIDVMYGIIIYNKLF